MTMPCGNTDAYPEDYENPTTGDFDRHEPTEEELNFGEPFPVTDLESRFSAAKRYLEKKRDEHKENDEKLSAILMQGRIDNMQRYFNKLMDNISQCEFEKRCEP